MANCNITLSGIDFGCKDSTGGLKQVWLCDWATAGVALTSDSKKATATTASFKLYRFRTGNASMNTTLNADEANGTVYAQTELNMKFTKLTDDIRTEAVELLKGNVAAIALDNNGKYWVLGLEHPLTLSAGTFNTGAALSDFNGFDVTLTDYCSTVPYMLDDTKIADLPTTVTTSSSSSSNG